PTRPAAVNVRYWSPLPSATQGQAAEWPDGDTPRVFAYLKGDYGPVDAILTALKTAPFRTLAHVPGLAPEVARRVSGGSLRIASGAVNMVEVGAQADAVLCNAGSGTVCTVLRHGIPSVLLPMHAEQYLFARRVEQIGAGVLLGEADARGKTVQAVQRILKEPVFRARARTFAQRHGADAQRDVAREVALRMEAMASG
ncbi:MAG: hypothetical protein KIT73_15935, partial [Burkholderiales bacterium]|nr:hypothetical protein [Burkholderiales bacterium]